MRRVLMSAWLLFIPSIAWGQAVVTTEMVAMRDGTRLATDVYLAPNWTTGPVILVRTTYNKDGLSDLGNALAGYGLFAVVVQDTRGRYASEGVDTVFLDDACDGADTMAWILAQPWCNGRVGTMGGSALGITQYMLAGQGPLGLQCQWVDIATPDLYSHAMFQGGVFRAALIENWLAGQGSLHMLPEIEAHPMLDAFWDPVRLEGLYSNVNWPAVHFGGWYDIFGQGTLDAFSHFDADGGPNARGAQKLVMGPWTHGDYFDRDQGELTYPADAAWNEGEYGAAQLDWFGWCLKNQASGADAWPAVRYYLMGAAEEAGAPGNQWLEADTWPPVGFVDQAWFLQPDGALSPEGPPAEEGVTAFPSDPADPVPTVCGANLSMAAGPCDQAPLVEGRSDVAVFSSEVLAEPVIVTGRIRVRLFFSADVTDCDLAVRLTDVYPDGRSMLVLDGALRARHRNGFEAEQLLTPGQVVEGFVDLWSTAIAFAPGHRIRISVSGSNAPRFDPNPQTGEPFRQQTRLQAGTISLHHGPDTPSALILPVQGAGPDPDGGIGDADGGGGEDGGLDAGDEDGVVEDGGVDDGGADDVGPDAGADGAADEGPADADPVDDRDDPGDGGAGCGCATRPRATGADLLVILLLVGVLRRRWAQGMPEG